MRYALAWIALTAALGQQPAKEGSPPTGSMSGTVTEAVTGKPLADVDVYVRRAPKPELHTVTDSQGRYSVHDIEPGDPTVSVQAKLADRPGPPGAGSSRRVRLAPAQELTGVDFHLRTFAQISGKVVDHNKEPVPGVTVFLVSREYLLGTLRYVFAAASRTVGTTSLPMRSTSANHSARVSAFQITV